MVGHDGTKLYSLGLGPKERLQDLYWDTLAIRDAAMRRRHPRPNPASRAVANAERATAEFNEFLADALSRPEIRERHGGVYRRFRAHLRRLKRRGKEQVVKER